MSKTVAHRAALLLAALAACLALAAGAGAATIHSDPADGTFVNGYGGWTNTSSCGVLCTVTNSHDTAGASTPGSLKTAYTTTVGVLTTVTGTSTFSSPDFTWNGASPDAASLTFARKASIAGLLASSGTAASEVAIVDDTSATTTVVVNEPLTVSDTAFLTRTLAVPPSVLASGDSYHLEITTSFSAPASVLGNNSVNYDDVALGTTTADPAGGFLVPDSTGQNGGGSGANGTNGTGTDGTNGANGTNGTNGGIKTPAAKKKVVSIRLVAARKATYARGHVLTLKVRALRSKTAVKSLAITVKAGGKSYRLVTSKTGYATLRLKPTAKTLKVAYRVGNAQIATLVTRTR
jgi:hypothetical protein